MSVVTGKKLLNVRETAKLLGVSERSLWSITAPRGKLQCVRLGNRVLYSENSLDRYIAEMERESVNPSFQYADTQAGKTGETFDRFVGSEAFDEA
jgi:phage antirepressor YoqD-like protein